VDGVPSVAVSPGTAQPPIEELVALGADPDET
jgi:hypothetical protein